MHSIPIPAGWFPVAAMGTPYLTVICNHYKTGPGSQFGLWPIALGRIWEDLGSRMGRCRTECKCHGAPETCVSISWLISNRFEALQSPAWRVHSPTHIRGLLNPEMVCTHPPEGPSRRSSPSKYEVLQASREGKSS